MKTKRAPRKADPYSPKKLDQELGGLLSTIPLYEPGWRPWSLDETENKLFAINLARILSHHGLSVAKAADLLDTSFGTLLRWLQARRRRPFIVADNMARHLGVSAESLVDRVLSFNEVENLKLGEGWMPPAGWHRNATDEAGKKQATNSDDDDDPADWWKRGSGVG